MISGGRLADPWRLVAYFSGLAVLFVALYSGLDAYASLLFFVHMIQHLLILLIVPPLIWLGNPYPFVMWGLPRSLRLRMSALLATPSPFRQLLRRLTTPMLAWLYLVAVVWIWHDSNMYNLTLRYELIHDFEHLSFFIVALIFWWHAVGASPILHRPMGYFKRAGFVLAAGAQHDPGGGHFLRHSVTLHLLYNRAPLVGDLGARRPDVWRRHHVGAG